MNIGSPAPEVFNVYAISASVVALHLLTIAGITGYLRARAKKFVNPEDAKLNKGEAVEAEDEAVARSKRAHQNLIESALPFFPVALLYVMTGATHNGAAIYMYTFVAVRILHTIFYMLGKQPFRTISFAIGAATIMGMAVHVIRASL